MSNAVIHTGLYTTASKDVIEVLRRRLSGDMFSVSKKDRYVSLDRYCKTQVEPDGEIMLKFVDNYAYYSSFSRCHSIQKQYEWLAWRLKLCVFKELERFHCDRKHDLWNRTNETVIKYLSGGNITVTIADIYCIYDILMNRKNIERKYSAERIAKFKGTQRDPFMTQMEINRREEIENIKKRTSQIVDELYIKCRDEKNKIEASINDKYNALIDEARAKAKKEIEDLNATVNATLSLAG